MGLTFDARQDIKRFLAVGGVSLGLIIGTTAGATAATIDADRDGLSGGQEVRITETNPNDADSNNDGVRDGDEDEDGVDNEDEDDDDDGVVDEDDE